MLTVRPLTLLREGAHRVDNLFLDSPPAASRTQALLGKLRATLSALPSTGREVEPPLQAMDGTARMLHALDELLLNAAERGAASRDIYASELANALRRLHDTGLAVFDGDIAMDAAALLRACYVSHLARECLARGV